MNVSKITLCNFGAKEGVVEYDLEAGFSRFPPDDAAIVEGIRFVLDHSFRHPPATSHLTGQFVELLIKRVDDEDTGHLRIRRHVDEYQYVLVNELQVAVASFFLELGEVMCSVDSEWFDAIEKYSAKDWLLNVLRTEMCYDREDPLLALDESKKGLHGLAQWDAFLGRRFDGFQVIEERSRLIRKARTLDKCRKKNLKSVLLATTRELSQTLDRSSRQCDALQSTVRELTLALIEEQTTTMPTCLAPEAVHRFSIDCELSDLFLAVHGQAKQVAALLSSIAKKQRQNFCCIMEEQNPEPPSRRFQLEVNLLLLELAQVPEGSARKSLEREKLQLAQRHDTLYRDLCQHQDAVEEKLRSNGEQLSEFVNQVSQLTREYEAEMAHLNRVITACKLEVEAANRVEVDKISKRARLDEYRRLLVEEEDDALASPLRGISSLLRLLERDEYAAVKGREFVGPVFQWVHFRADTNVAAKSRIRHQLRNWLLVVIVKSRAFADQLMQDFNGRQLEGTVRILPCDYFRFKITGRGQPADSSLIQFLEMEDDHPLRSLLSAILSTEPSADGLLPAEEARELGRDLYTSDTELWLQAFYKTDVSLIELEGIRMIEEAPENRVAGQFDTAVGKVFALAGLSAGNATEFLYAQKTVQDVLMALYWAKKQLLRVDWRQRINERLWQLMTSGELERDSRVHYEQVHLLFKAADGMVTACPTYDPSEAEQQIEELGHVLECCQDIDLNRPITIARAVHQQDQLYVDSPHSENYEELLVQRKLQLTNARQCCRGYWRTHTLLGAWEGAARDLQMDTSRVLNAREHSQKALPQLELELLQLEREFNVYPKSRERKSGTQNYMGKLRDQMQPPMHCERTLEVGLRNFLDYERSTGKVAVLQRIMECVNQFYEEVRPGSVERVEIICQLAAVANGHLAADDLSGLEIVFITPEGNLRADDVEPSALAIFGLSLLFAKMKLNNVRLLTAVGVEHLDGDIWQRILYLFLCHNFQVVQSQSLAAQE